MSEKKKIIITIARAVWKRRCGCRQKVGGRSGISFYDKNILRRTSDESGIKESYFHLADEKAGNRLFIQDYQYIDAGKGAHRRSVPISFQRRQSVPLPVGSDPEAGGGGILRHHRPLRGLCAGRHRGTDPRVPLRGYQGARGARA